MLYMILRMNMLNQDDLSSIKDDVLHALFMNMVLDYGPLMTGVDASVIGKIQAEITLAGMAACEKDIPDIIQQKMREAEDHMLQPSNSCGDQSNQICHLFLGKTGAQTFSDVPYELLMLDGANLQRKIDETKEQLIRFELDRAITPQAIIKHPKVRTIADLYAQIKSDNTAQFQNRLVLLPGSFCFVDTANNVKPLQIINSDVIQLSDLYQTIACAEPTLFPIDDPFEKSKPVDLEDEMSSLLARIGRRQIENVDFGWCSTHSFTAYIPKTTQNNAPLLYMYQAYMGRHTLQQWFKGNKFSELSRETPVSFIKRLATMCQINNDREQVKTQEASLFSLGGSDERRILNNPLARGALSVRLKYKVADVDVRLALMNLKELQAYIDKTYPNLPSIEQLASYYTQAKEAMKIAMQDHLALEIQQQCSSSAQSLRARI